MQYFSHPEKAWLRIREIGYYMVLCNGCRFMEGLQIKFVSLTRGKVWEEQQQRYLLHFLQLLEEPSRAVGSLRESQEKGIKRPGTDGLLRPNVVCHWSVHLFWDSFSLNRTCLVTYPCQSVKLRAPSIFCITSTAMISACHQSVLAHLAVKMWAIEAFHWVFWPVLALGHLKCYSPPKYVFRFLGSKIIWLEILFPFSSRICK